MDCKSLIDTTKIRWFFNPADSHIYEIPVGEKDIIYSLFYDIIEEYNKDFTRKEMSMGESILALMFG